METLVVILRMVARRSVGHWRLLIATGAGVLFSAALMASVFMYSDAVRDLGLKYTLDNQPPLGLDLDVFQSSMPFSGGDFAQPKQLADSLISRQVGGVTDSVVHFGRSATFFPAPPGQQYPADEGRPRANLVFGDDLSKHIKIVAGRAPAAFQAPPSGQAPSIEVLVGAETARQGNIHVGQSFDIFPFWRTTQPIHVTVSGFAEPIDANDPYWFGATGLFDSTTTDWVTIAMFTSQQAVIDGAGAYLTDMRGDFHTYVYVDPGKINHANANAVQSHVQALSALISRQVPDGEVDTQLDTVIQNYRDHLFFARLPLLALMIQVVGIVLFYLVIVSAMSIERQAGEIALFRSRGAGLGQVVLVYFIEAFAMAIVATVGGPFLAAGAIALLGLTSPFHALSGGHLLSAPYSWAAFGMAALGALCAMAAMLWPAYRAARLSITNYKQQASRPQQQSFFTRYYLDLALLAVAAVLLYELRQHHALFTENVFGKRSADPLLVASPTLFMVIVALIVLRIFPLALRLVLWVARHFEGATVSLGLARMARNPVQHSRLILLLILATGVGMFAAGFRATLEQGYRDQSAYAAGSALRISGIDSPNRLPPPEFASTVARATNGNDVVPAVRTDGYYDANQFSSTAFTLLAVPSQSFGPIAYWRGDFAQQPLGPLLQKITPPKASAAAPQVRDDARYIGVWMQTPVNIPKFTAGIQLIDSDGASWDYTLTRVSQAPIGPNSWQFYVADLSRPSYNRPATSPDASERHWTLGTVFLDLPTFAPLMPTALTVLFSDVQTSATAASASGFADPAVIESFKDLGNYGALRGESPGGDAGAVTGVPATAPRTGTAARLSFSFARGNPTTVGVHFNRLGGGGLLPVLASEDFLKQAGKNVGDVLTLSVNGTFMQARIAGSFKLFPTYDPESDKPLVVTDLNAFNAQAIPVANLAYPNEAWIGSRPAPVTMKQLSDKGVHAGEISDRQAIFAQDSSDPLIAAGWEGILFLAFAAVLILSAVAFIAYCALAAQARSLEFAILRTMGFSARQVLGVVGFEQGFVILAGLIAGTLLGFPLGRLMTGYLALNAQGRDPLPPLVSVVNWEALAVIYGSLLVVVVAVIGVLVALYTRLAIGRALRMGEL